MPRPKRKFTSSMARASKHGSTAPSTTATGGTVWLRARVPFIMPTAMFIPVSSTRIELMDSVFTFILTDRDTKDSGKMTIKTGQVKKNLRMGLNMMACSRMERSGDKEPTSGLMRVSILEAGLTTISKAMENTDGPMAEFTKVSGKRTSSMEGASTLGPMEESMKEITRMIKNMDMELTLGPMANHTKDSGRMESSTARLDLQTQRVGVKWESGRTARESNGLTPSPLFSQNHLPQLAQPSMSENSNRMLCENLVRSLQNNEHKLFNFKEVKNRYCLVLK